MYFLFIQIFHHSYFQNKHFNFFLDYLKYEKQYFKYLQSLDDVDQIEKLNIKLKTLNLSSIIIKKSKPKKKK